VLDNSIDDGRVGEESDDAHLTATLRADHRVNLIDFSDHLGPAPGRDGPEFLPNNPEGKRPWLAFLTFPRWALAYRPK
jgi:hypothetical protein